MRMGKDEERWGKHFGLACGNGLVMDYFSSSSVYLWAVVFIWNRLHIIMVL